MTVAARREAAAWEMQELRKAVRELVRRDSRQLLLGKARRIDDIATGERQELCAACCMPAASNLVTDGTDGKSERRGEGIKQ